MKPYNLYYSSRPDSEAVYGSKKLRRLLRDFTYYINGKKYIIPAGFEWDGASVPGIFWLCIGTPHDSWFEIASLIHDWIYLTHILSRVNADEILRIALIAECVSSAKACTMWLAVRVGGSGAWKNGQKEAEQLSKLKSILADRDDHNYWADQQMFEWLRY